MVKEFPIVSAVAESYIDVCSALIRRACNMRKCQHIAIIIAFLNAVVLSSANSKMIEGQVFIVTAGAQAIKLPLVQVVAISQAETARHISDVELRIGQEQAKVDAAVVEARKAKRAIEDGYAAWVKSHDFTVAADVQKYRVAHQHLLKAEERLGEALGRQKVLRSAAPYFVDLPASTATAKTDADGRFKLNLPDEGDFAVLASSTRTVFNKVEKYFWVVRLKSQDSTVTLSNDNLTTSGSPDSLLTTKE
jgi:hypothetical protein